MVICRAVTELVLVEEREAECPMQFNHYRFVAEGEVPAYFCEVCHFMLLSGEPVPEARPARVSDLAALEWT